MARELRSRRLWLLAALLAMLAVLVGLYLLRGALLPLGISAVIAYILLPPARLLERAMPWREKRPLLSRLLAVSLIFLTALGALLAAGVMAVASIVRQGQRFVASFPQFIDAARAQVEIWVADYNRLLPPQVRDRAEEWLSNAGGLLGDAAWNIASQTIGAITGSFSFLIGLATAPVLIFYLMKDADPIRESLYAPFPSRLRPYLRDLMDIVHRSVGGYIRGQLVLGLLVGVVVTAGLLALGIPFAVILGIVAGLTELIPIIGPLDWRRRRGTGNFSHRTGQSVVGYPALSDGAAAGKRLAGTPGPSQYFGAASHSSHSGHHRRQPVFRLVGGNSRPARSGNGQRSSRICRRGMEPNGGGRGKWRYCGYGSCSRNGGQYAAGVSAEFSLPPDLLPAR